jgi:hypothetical protein
LFFNPFVWRLCAAVRREREHCCDDFVLAHTTQPAAYAYALADLARLQHSESSLLAPAASGNSRRPLLLNRIKRIMEMKRPASRPAPIILACCIAAIIIATSIACFSPSLAQRSRKPKGETEQAPAPDSSYTHISGTVIIDSNGHRRQYSSIDKMPPAERAALQQHLRDLDDTMRNIGPRIAASLAGLGDSINTTVAQAMASVDWKQINRQIDSAMKEVDAVDWASISREVHRGLAEADRALNDPKMKAEMRRAMAMAQREIAQGRDELRREQVDMSREARQSLEEARRDAEEARKEADDLRRELEQMRQEKKREKGNRE